MAPLKGGVGFRHHPSSELSPWLHPHGSIKGHSLFPPLLSVETSPWLHRRGSTEGEVIRSFVTDDGMDLHGYIAMAPLKVWQRSGVSRRSRHLHGYIAMASLLSDPRTLVREPSRRRSTGRSPSLLIHRWLPLATCQRVRWHNPRALTSGD